MSVRVPAPAPARLVVVATVLVAAVLSGLLGPTSAGAATSTDASTSTTSARASGPAYGPWSDYYYDVRARVSTPTKKQARTYVQVQRKRGTAGNRQFRLTWHSSGKAQRTGASKNVAQGTTITLATSALPCGRTRVTLQGRSRAPGGAYGAWKSFGAVLDRAC